MNDLSKYHLFQCRTKQPLRVSKGKSCWFWFDLGMIREREWDLREILSDEIVIELDNDDRKLCWNAIKETMINLSKDNIHFELWNHKGKCPHLHIRNLSIPQNLEKKERKRFKEVFIKHYVPEEYHKWIDLSLCGIHLVALEGMNHWKGKYSVKILEHKFEGDISQLNKFLILKEFK